MKKIRNSIIIIISMIIIFSINCVLTKSYATSEIIDNPTFYIEGRETEAGNNVMVTLYASSVNGISAANIKIKYDENIEFVKFQKDEGIDSATASSNNNEVAVVFNNNKDITGMFQIGTFLFKIPDNAQPNTSYDVKISEVDKIVSISEGEILNYYSQDSNIMVLEPIQIEENIVNENINNSNNNNDNIKKVIIISTVIFVAIAIMVTIVVSKSKKKKNNN